MNRSLERVLGDYLQGGGIASGNPSSLLYVRDSEHLRPPMLDDVATVVQVLFPYGPPEHDLQGSIQVLGNFLRVNYEYQLQHPTQAAQALLPVFKKAQEQADTYVADCRKHVRIASIARTTVGMLDDVSARVMERIKLRQNLLFDLQKAHSLPQLVDKVLGNSYREMRLDASFAREHLVMYVQGSREEEDPVHLLHWSLYAHDAAARLSALEDSARALVPYDPTSRTPETAVHELAAYLIDPAPTPDGKTTKAIRALLFDARAGCKSYLAAKEFQDPVKHATHEREIIQSIEQLAATLAATGDMLAGTELRAEDILIQKKAAEENRKAAETLLVDLHYRMNQAATTTAQKLGAKLFHPFRTKSYIPSINAVLSTYKHYLRTKGVGRDAFCFQQSTEELQRLHDFVTAQVATTLANRVRYYTLAETLVAATGTPIVSEKVLHEIAKEIDHVISHEIDHTPLHHEPPSWLPLSRAIYRTEQLDLLFAPTKRESWLKKLEPVHRVVVQELGEPLPPLMNPVDDIVIARATPQVSAPKSTTKKPARDRLLVLGEQHVFTQGDVSYLLEQLDKAHVGTVERSRLRRLAMKAEEDAIREVIRVLQEKTSGGKS